MLVLQKRKEAYRKEKEAKYAPAIAIYSRGERSAQAVAAEFGFSVTAFRSYLRAHHPDLVALVKEQRASARKSERACGYQNNTE